MLATTLLFPSSAALPYERWYMHFLENGDATASLPWHDPYLLSPAERKLVGPSIQQFQLGEWARGRGFKRRASAEPSLAADPWFLPALDLFIAEEQGHSNMLGRFLDREGIPRLSHNWLDGTFRRLRKLAGLEVCAAVLVTAEVLAMPFYQALRDATRSRLLRSICVHILRDEAAHLNYQALTLGLVRRSLSGSARTIHSACHSVLFLGTALLVWQQHRRMFGAAGWSFGRFWNDARHWFALLQVKIRRASLGAGSFDDLRLD
jgi:hypothetical protein